MPCNFEGGGGPSATVRGCCAILQGWFPIPQGDATQFALMPSNLYTIELNQNLFYTGRRVLSI